MLLIKAKAGPSVIQGIGVIASEYIPKGTLVWQFNATVDKAYTSQGVEALDESLRNKIKSLHHAYISLQTGRYIDPGDDAKFMNHSVTPNTASKYVDGVEEDVGYALRDIEAGEELTIDYNTFAKEGVDFT